MTYLIGWAVHLLLLACAAVIFPCLYQRRLSRLLADGKRRPVRIIRHARKKILGITFCEIWIEFENLTGTSVIASKVLTDRQVDLDDYKSGTQIYIHLSQQEGVPMFAIEGVPVHSRRVLLGILWVVFDVVFYGLLYLYLFGLISSVEKQKIVPGNYGYRLSPARPSGLEFWVSFDAVQRGYIKTKVKKYDRLNLYLSVNPDTIEVMYLDDDPERAIVSSF